MIGLGGDNALFCGYNNPPPEDVGADGDWYVWLDASNTVGAYMFGPKKNGAWPPKGFPLRGLSRMSGNANHQAVMGGVVPSAPIDPNDKRYWGGVGGGDYSGNGQAQAAPQRPLSVMETELSTLSMNVAELEEVLNVFRGRLLQVAEPLPEQNTGDKPPAPELRDCRLVDYIVHQSNRVGAMRIRMLELLERLHV